MTTKQHVNLARNRTDNLSTRIADVRATFDSGRTRPVEWRMGQLRALLSALSEGEQMLADALKADLGRPENDSFLGDIAPAAAEARHAIKHLEKWMRRRRVRLPVSQLPGRAWYEYEPLGVTLIIGPWNYPVYLTLGPLVAAIAAGNCAVIKPSEHAPATAHAIRMLVENMLDPEAFIVVEGGPEATQEVLAKGMDLAFFTGGPEVGKAVMAAAAPHLTPVILELGGKCPAVIDHDANLAVAARRIAWTKLMNSGQTCIAPDYLMVHDAVLPAFQDELLKAINDLSPNRDGGKMLPIVSPRHAARLEGLLENHGGTVLSGGNVDAAMGKADLTVVLDPSLQSNLMTEEIFGPILPVVEVKSVDSAISHIQSGPKPLAAYLFSETGAMRRDFRRRIAAGAVVSNHVAMHVLVPGLPFGGVGNSGMGAYHGRWGFEAFSHRKANLHRLTALDLRAVYPPYNALTEKLLRKIF